MIAPLNVSVIGMRRLTLNPLSLPPCRISRKSTTLSFYNSPWSSGPKKNVTHTVAVAIAAFLILLLLLMMVVLLLVLVLLLWLLLLLLLFLMFCAPKTDLLAATGGCALEDLGLLVRRQRRVDRHRRPSMEEVIPPSPPYNIEMGEKQRE